MMNMNPDDIYYLESATYKFFPGCNKYATLIYRNKSLILNAFYWDDDYLEVRDGFGYSLFQTYFEDKHHLVELDYRDGNVWITILDIQSETIVTEIIKNIRRVK